MSSTPVIAAPPRPDDFLDWVHLFSRAMEPSDEVVLMDVLRILFPDARDLKVKGLAQGWSRAAYRIEVDGQVMFGKHLPADASDRERAAFAHHVAVSQWAATRNLAPTILGYHAPTQTMLTPFVTQGAATPRMVAAADPVIKPVLQTLKRFHDAAAPAELLQGAPRQFTRLDGNIAQLRVHPIFPRDRLAQVEQLRGILGQRLQASMDSQVLCHNDFNPYNALSDGRDAWLIDFEWASRGDPMADVARFACGGDLDATELPALLAMYDSSADANMLYRLNLWVLAVDLERYADASLTRNDPLAAYCLARVSQTLAHLASVPNAAPATHPVTPHVVTSARGPLVIDRAFVINLDTRPDRWQRITHHVHKELGWNLPLIRQPAHDTRKWTAESGGLVIDNSFAPVVEVEQLPILQRNFRTEAWHLQPGTVGCTLSHMALWSLCGAHRDSEYMLILEDDAFWSYEMRWSLEQLTQELKRIPNDWDMLLLGAMHNKAIQHFGNYAHLDGFWCLHAYIIHRAAVPRLMQDMLPIHDSLGWTMSRKAKGLLKVYCVTPNLFWQNPNNNDSDIKVEDVRRA